MICNLPPGLCTSPDSPQCEAVLALSCAHTHTSTQPDTRSCLHNSCGTLLHFGSLAVFLSCVRGSRQDHLFAVQIAATRAVRRQVLRVCECVCVVWHGGRVHLLGSALAKPGFAGSLPWFSCPKPRCYRAPSTLFQCRAENMQNKDEGTMILAGVPAESTVLQRWAAMPSKKMTEAKLNQIFFYADKLSYIWIFFVLFFLIIGWKMLVWYQLWILSAGPPKGAFPKSGGLMWLINQRTFGKMQFKR